MRSANVYQINDATSLNVEVLKDCRVRSYSYKANVNKLYLYLGYVGHAINIVLSPVVRLEPTSPFFSPVDRPTTEAFRVVRDDLLDPQIVELLKSKAITITVNEGLDIINNSSEVERIDGTVASLYPLLDNLEATTFILNNFKDQLPQDVLLTFLSSRNKIVYEMNSSIDEKFYSEDREYIKNLLNSLITHLVDIVRMTDIKTRDTLRFKIRQLILAILTLASESKIHKHKSNEA
jgi:hypothetical protein